jgi:UDP-N-acetylglucosamine:LPS N-acetylglucosamine transferase
MKRKKIILVSLFNFIKEEMNSRANTIYDFLKDKSDVEIVMGNFDHMKKKHYLPTDTSSRKTTMIPVLAYRKNLELKRIFSHMVFAFRLKKYLKSLRETPDVIMCIMPPSLAAFVCAGYCKKNKIAFAIDVLDLWPESLIPLSPFKKTVHFITWPWKLVSRSVYRKADLIFGDSDIYAGFPAKFNKKTKPVTVYLGTDVPKFEHYLAQSRIKIEKPKNEIWICYGGSLGFSYDFDVMLNSFKSIYQQGNQQIKFYFIGGGPKHAEIQAFAENNHLPVIITGYLELPDYYKYLNACDIAINAFKPDTLVVHSYKFNDYLSAGLAVLNNLPGETTDFINQYQCGRNFDYHTNFMPEVLLEMISDPAQLQQMKQNAKKAARDILAADIIYQPMINALLK